jgi:hypothetical protein
MLLVSESQLLGDDLGGRSLSVTWRPAASETFAIFRST